MIYHQETEAASITTSLIITIALFLGAIAFHLKTQLIPESNRIQAQSEAKDLYYERRNDYAELSPQLRATTPLPKARAVVEGEQACLGETPSGITKSCARLGYDD